MLKIWYTNLFKSVIWRAWGCTWPLKTHCFILTGPFLVAHLCTPYKYIIISLRKIKHDILARIPNRFYDFSFNISNKFPLINLDSFKRKNIRMFCLLFTVSQNISLDHFFTTHTICTILLLFLNNVSSFIEGVATSRSKYSVRRIGTKWF